VLKNEFQLDQEISVSLLASMPDVLKLRPDINDEDEILKNILVPVEDASNKLNTMRGMEGKKLAEDINSRSQKISDHVKEIEKRAPNVVVEYKEKLQERIGELLGEHAVLDEERLALETAVFADKCSIAEELVRLDSHIHQLEKNVQNNEPSGRKLDFLVQEMNREINTIGSKANDLEITNFVVDIKSEIEKIREQIQNIE
ncbi:MAG: YicC family protein, partial [Clostridia bacterium]|nr:YicC family protein [Clostridia bacterium]